MDFSLPTLPADAAGCTVHPGTIDDAPELLQLERDTEIAVTGESAWTLDEISEPFSTQNGRANTAVVVVRRGDTLIGNFQLSHDNGDRYYGEATIDHQLDPAVYRALSATAFAWSEHTVLAHAEAAARLKYFVWEGDEPLRAALTTAGYTLERGFYEMHIDLADVTSYTPPPDVTIRRAEIGDGATDDARLAHHLVTETFRDHYDFMERPFDKWIARHRDSPNADFGSWWIAEIDSEPVGVRIDDSGYLESHNAGYVANLGTLRSARGRGVAKALLAHSFEMAAARNQVAVKLHVDSESPTGATKLYESVGMRRNHTGHEWQKMVRGAE